MPRFSLRTLVLATFLVAAYFGSYLALVSRIGIVDQGHLGMVINGRIEAKYGAGGEAARILFLPAEWLDRTLRPAKWDVHQIP
jgi:hypothetical protein